MTKQIIPYLLLAACLFSACQSVYYEPETGTPVAGEMLSLTVSASDLVATDGTHTRAVTKGLTTTFEKDDTVGLIILAKDGRLLVDNVPYIFDGKKWNTEQTVYYDGTMGTYIVYYPYTEEASGYPYDGDPAKVTNYIRGLEVFKHQQDQSTYEAYRQSDPMVWISTDKPKADTDKPERLLDAQLWHLRNSLLIDLKVQWELTNGETITYRPKDYLLDVKNKKDIITDTIPVPAYEYFRIKYTDSAGEVILKNFNVDKEADKADVKKDSDITYHDKDSSYRYILPDDYEGEIEWRYTYRDITFSGKCTVPAPSPQPQKGKCYMQDETAYMGEFASDKVKEGDFYCSKDNIGFPLPCDALDCLITHDGFTPYRCIGIILYAGPKHHETDLSWNTTKPENFPYPPNVEANESCHGYVLALTEAKKDPHYWCNGNYMEPMGTNLADDAWEGYCNHSRIRKYIEDNNLKKEDFPAFYACETYGTEEWATPLAAPENTTGWFLPSYGQLIVLKDNHNIIRRLNVIAEINRTEKYITLDKGYIGFDNLGHPVDYWTSTENTNGKTVKTFKESSRAKNSDGGGVSMITHAVLAF